MTMPGAPIRPLPLAPSSEAEAFDRIYDGVSDVALQELIDECDGGLRQMRQAVLDRRRARRAALQDLRRRS